MSDPIEDLLKRANGGAELPGAPEVQTGKPLVVDPVEDLLKRAEPGVEAAPLARPEDDPITSLLQRADPSTVPPSTPSALPGMPEVDSPYAPVPGRKPFQDVFVDSIHRGVSQIKATVPLLQGLTAESMGYLDEAKARFDEAQAITVDDPTPVVGSLEHVKDATDFAYWLTEKLGEQGPILATSLATGGLTALLTGAVSRGLLTTQAARTLAMRIGGGVGAFAATAPFETADTAEELYKATGSFQPLTSLTAGTAKGALELFTPMRLLGKFSPGKTFEGGFIREVLKTGVTEASTELAQEEISIAARKYADPSYSYFGHEANWRRIEAGVAGGLVGMGYGAPIEGAARVVKGRRTGDTLVDPADYTNSPLSMLKRWVPYLRGQKQEDNVNAKIITPKIDNFEVSSFLPTVGKLWGATGIDASMRSQVYDLLERNTARFAFVDEATGKTRRFVNATDVERLGTKVPMQEDLRKKLVEVDQSSLIPAGITADLNDVDLTSRQRVYFIPGTTEQEKARLSREFEQLQGHLLSELPGKRESGEYSEVALHAYGLLLDDGLRVLPSPGSSFLYSGDFKGTAVKEVPRSRRSKLPLTFTTNKSIALTGAVPSNLTKVKNEQVTIDLAKLPKNSYLPAVSGTIPFDTVYAVPSHISKEQVNLWKNQYSTVPSAEARIDLLNEMLEAGVTAKASTDTLGPATTLVLSKDLDLARLMTPLPGIPATTTLQAGTNFRYTKDAYNYTNYTVDMNLSPVASATEMRVAKELQEWLKALTPEINKLLRALNAPALAAISIESLTAGYAGRYHFDTNTIDLVVHNAFSIENIRETFFHELGHLLTIHWFTTLPSELAAQLDIAYQRSLLAYRLDPIAFNRLGTRPRAVHDSYYFFSKIEYLAEQAVRWFIANGDSETFLHSQFKQLNEMFKALKTVKVKQGIEGFAPVSRDLIEPDYTFARIMEYFWQKDRLGTPPKDAISMLNPAGPVSTFHPLPDEDRQRTVTLPDGTQIEGIPITQAQFSADQPITAYHGSPHNFDQFNLDKIGTGEGNQAFGYGLYFAENEDVAKQYREQLSDHASPGHMYEVRIEADPDQFLDFDAPLSKQTESVKKALERAYSDVKNIYDEPVWPGKVQDDAAGPQLLASIAGTHAVDKQAQANKLREAGIPGIRYLDQKSRAAGEGTYNYVVFDADLISIISKDGQPVGNERYGMYLGLVPEPTSRGVSSLLNNVELSSTNPVLQELDAVVQQALNEMGHRIPDAYSIGIKESFNLPGVRASANRETRAITIAVEALNAHMNGLLTHEAIHAVRELGLFTDQEWAILAASVHENKTLMDLVYKFWGPEYRRNSEAYAQAFADKGEPLPDGWVDARLHDILTEEAVAVSMQFSAEAGYTGTEAQTLYNRIAIFIEKLFNALKGKGFVSIEDIRRKFFRGELQNKKAQSSFYTRMDRYMAVETSTEVITGKTIQIAPDLTVLVSDTNSAKSAVYYFFTTQKGNQKLNTDVRFPQMGPVAGSVFLHNTGVKGWEVDMVRASKLAYQGQTRPNSFSTDMYNFIEQDLNTKLKPSGVLLPDGYKMWVKRSPETVAYHVYDKTTDTYFSPNYIKQRKLYYADRVKNSQNMPRQAREAYVKESKYWNELYKKVPAKVWNNPALINAFSLDTKQVMYDTTLAMVEQERAGDENNLLNADDTPSDFDQIDTMKLKASREENAKILNVPIRLAAPAQPEMYAMKNLLKWNQLTPKQKRALTGTFAEADRIGWFSKKWWGLHQLMWANPHFLLGREYLQTIEAWSARREQWIARADATAKEWDKLYPKEQKAKLADILFYVTEMRYLSALERAQGVVRKPTQAELLKIFKDHKVTRETAYMYYRVESDFLAFLDEAERINKEAISRQFAANPIGQTQALNKLAADMAQLRNKPYFPMARFGEWTLTARDPNANNTVKAFYTFATESERNNYIQIAAAKHPHLDLRISRLSPDVHEFLGVPGPLLRRIKAELPGLTIQQKDWLDQFEHLSSPENSFRKRWLHRQGTEGYSLDAFRVYANYFNTGANYLARLEYKDQAQRIIREAEVESKQLADGTKRMQIITEMQDHLNYMLESGRDWGKLKALGAIFYLGFSPMAAAMNLTQLPLVTIPYLGRLYGLSAVNRAFSLTNNALKATFGGIIQNPKYPGYELARQEMMEQGKIDAGQAPEMGAYASGNNLTRTAAGDLTQTAIRNIATSSMWMFGKTERFNRELTFAMTFNLTMENLNNSYVSELRVTHIAQINELMSRVGLTLDEATATIAVRDAIDKTHFIYAPWARPKFMRNNKVAVVAIFYQYIQGSLYSIRNNPGGIINLLVLASLFGVMGLPFADDLDKVLEAVARRIFGKDFSLERAMREFVKNLTEGTIFDKTGPDLFLHGLSRFGFGSGLLPDGWGAPRFDASANGSMGRVIPALPEMISAWGKYGNYNEILGKGLQQGSGAVFSWMFSMLQLMSSDPHTADYKKWELLMQRQVKAISKAGRYALTGKETYPSGGTLAQFDLKDPDDVATILAQLAGATPLEVNLKREVRNAAKDTVQFYTGWKKSLYAQMDEAVRSQTPTTIEKVLSAIQVFNSEVTRQGYGSLAVTPQTVLSSIKNRARTREMEEQGLPVQRGQIPVYQKMQELYPLLERKKVK